MRTRSEEAEAQPEEGGGTEPNKFLGRDGSLRSDEENGARFLLLGQPRGKTMIRKTGLHAASRR